MIAKTFEIWDRGTFIPALAVRLDPSCEEDRYLLARAGFGSNKESQGKFTILFHLERDVGHWDVYHWDTSERTMPQAHLYIENRFDDLKSGQVIDVQVILGETTEPKKSERITAPF